MPRTESRPRRLSRRRHSAILLGGVAILVPTLAACSSGPRVCTAIGAVGGVGVTLDPGLVPAGAPVTITACVNDVCQTQAYANTESQLFVVMSSMKGGDVTVSISVTTGDRRVFSGRTTTQSIKNQPNGPGCPPTVWGVSVTAHANGQLTA